MCYKEIDPSRDLTPKEMLKMLSSSWHLIRLVVVSVLVVVFAVQPNLMAQTHVVSPSELQKEAEAVTLTRERNVASIHELLSSSQAQKSLRAAKMDPIRVKNAVSTLTDEELVQLASRAQAAQTDFAAGRLEDRDLLLIILGMAALVLIIVAVR
jgi:hypothetical protein